MDTVHDTLSCTRRLPIEKIHPSTERYYYGVDHLDELAGRMRIYGLVDPIVVKPVKDGYEIVNGMRRWQAARMLGWRMLDAKIAA